MSQQTDAQAALAAAATVMASWQRHPDVPLRRPYDFERHTLTMADSFLRWLDRQNRRPFDADDRIIPNIDFRSPSQAETERVDPGAVLAAAADRTLAVPTVQHVVSATSTTPSGKYACVCGEAWPCSQRDRGASR